MKEQIEKAIAESKNKVKFKGMGEFDIPFITSKDDAKAPVRHHDDDCGADLCTTTNFVLSPFERKKVGTGINIELPVGHYALVQAKSGLANRYGLTTIGNVIDEGYRGEIHVILVNMGSEIVSFEKGDKIAQLIIMPYVKSTFVKVDSLSETQRGEKGFGSSGR